MVATFFTVFLKQLKDEVTEKSRKLSIVEGEIAAEVNAEEEPEEATLTLKSLSITALTEQKCAQTFVRLNSINVELISDEMEFLRYVIDFAIDYATNDIVDVGGKMGDLRMKLALMLNIPENDERFVVAIQIIDQLIRDVIGEDEDIAQDAAEATALPVVDETQANNTPSEIVDEYFYNPSDPTRVHIPPVWTPTNARCNAALIYLYFRVVSFDQRIRWVD